VKSVNYPRVMTVAATVKKERHNSEKRERRAMSDDNLIPRKANHFSSVSVFQ
jgi:hypothetical protein